MAISKENFTDSEGAIRLTNGDFQALLEIAKNYGMEDESDVFAFALGVLNEAKGKPIILEKEDGRVIKFVPADNLVRKV